MRIFWRGRGVKLLHFTCQNLVRS